MSDVYQERMQTIYANLGGDPATLPPGDCLDTQGWWWHQVYLILGGDPQVTPPEGCKDIFGFWLQQIYISFGGDGSIWPPSDFRDIWGWWFQQICAVLGNDPEDWPPSDEMDCLNWWLLKLIEFSASGSKIPLRFYQKGGDLYVSVTPLGRSLGISEDDFEINQNGELIARTPINDELTRVGPNIIWTGGT
jgi:hypothetical protein